MGTAANTVESTASVATSTRGRPREFDDAAVLESLTDLFWAKGFEATSMADIVEATGLNKSSLYNAFGSKEAMFGLAVNHYVDNRAQMLTDFLEHGEQGLDDVMMMFDVMWREVESGDQRGCLAVNTSTELGPTDERAVEISTRYRETLRGSFRAAFGRAADRGEIDPTQIDAYANMITSMVFGMAVVVRGGAPKHEIKAHLDAARSVVDGWRVAA
ncbi:MAG: TetR/AcrR family transcriptional regulator [Acidimicrobiales bacterium]